MRSNQASGRIDAEGLEEMFWTGVLFFDEIPIFGLDHSIPTMFTCNYQACLRFYVLIFCFLAGFSLQAQKNANVFGFYNYELNFNRTPVSVTGQFATHEISGVGSICDSDGILQFYTDGYTVWNRRHAPMANGKDMLEKHRRGSGQQSIVIPKPGSTTRYYIFTVDPVPGVATYGLHYSEVDMTLNDGLGDVAVRPIRILTTPSNRFSAVFHRNGKDVWLISLANTSNTYSLLRITEQGISDDVIEQSIGSINYAWGGQLKFSPDGRKVASMCNEDINLFDFNDETGVLSNPMNFTFTELNGYPTIDALEFSSDATKLYTGITRNSTSEIYQFDVALPTYEQVKKSCARTPARNVYNLLSLFQLAPDGRIYVTKGGGGGGSDYLGVIANPNAAAKDIDFQENGLYLNGGESFVNTPPSFIQSYFFKTSFAYEGHCQGTPIKFRVTNEHKVDSVKWNFGNGQTSRSRTTEVVYKDAGEYNVTLQVYYGSKPTVITQQVSIWGYTSFDLGENFVSCPDNQLTAPEGYASYRWNTGDTTRRAALDATQWYTLKAVNTGGCAYRDSVFVTVKEGPTITLPDRVTFNGRPSVQLDAGVFSSYAWNTGEITRKITVTIPGWYSVSVQNATGCSAARSVFVGDVPPEQPEEVWTWLNPLPSGRTAKDVWFVNNTTGFIVNGYQILKTTDGGDTWAPQQNAQGNRIAFRNQIGYIVGNFGTVYKSTHNGGGWAQVPFGTIDNLNSVSVLHPDTVFVTSHTQVFATRDGGKTWTPHDIPNGQVVTAVFTSAKTGHAACQDGTILKTTDGGETWRVVRSTNTIPSNFLTMTFVNAKVGYATSEHSSIFKTTDGGETWQAMPNPGDAIYGAFFLNENLGYVTGEHGVIHKTVNGGNSWEWAGFLDGRYYAADMHALYFFDEDNGFAVGLRGRILRTYDGGKKWSPYGMTYADIHDIIFPSASTGYVLGDRIYKTTDYGKTWQPIINNPTDGYGYYSSGYFFSENKGFVVAENNYSSKAIQTTDGGKTWSETSIPGRVFSFLNEQQGFAGGYGIYKTTNGGTSWEHLSDLQVNDLHFISAQRGFAIRYGDLYKTVDGGVSWTLAYETYGDLTEIDFVNDKVGYISGWYGLVLKTIDGGETWVDKSTPYDHLLSIDFINENIGFTTGEYGQTFSTSDGGNTWTSEYMPAQVQNVRLSRGKVFVAGYYGALLSRTFETGGVTIQALAATEVQANTATLRGVVANNGGSVQNIRIEYGLNGTFSSSSALTPGSVATDENVEYAFPLSALQPDETYTYRLVATVNGTRTVSNIVAFHTPAEVELQPLYIADITIASARIWAGVKSNKSAITNLQFEYDTLSSFATKKTIQAEPASVEAGTYKYAEAVVEGLRPNTQYYIRLKGSHDGTVYASDVARFRTMPEFKITFGGVWSESNDVNLNAQVIAYGGTLTDVHFDYGLSRAYGATVEATPSEITSQSWGQINARITVPYRDSIYYYRVSGQFNGKPFVSDYNVFRLAGGVILRANAAKHADVTSVTVGGLVRLQGNYVFDLAFEYGTTTAFGNATPISGYDSYGDYLSVVADLTGLMADTQYFYRLTGQVLDGTVVHSDIRTFRTGNVTGIAGIQENALTLYPNPAEHEVTLVSSSRMEHVELLDAMGRPVVALSAPGFSCTLPVTGVPPGIYYLRIVQRGEAIVRKLVKQ